MKHDGTLTTLLTTDGYYTCNTTKGTPCLSADIFGDWREELIVRAADSKSVRIYATNYTTDYRITTLMHDAQYRMQVSAQNTAYNQPPHTSFFLGTGYDLPARPADSVNTTGVNNGKAGASINTGYNYKIKNKNSGLYLEVADARAENGANVQQGTSGSLVWRFEESAEAGYYHIYSELGDGKTYLLDLDYGKPDNGTNIGIWSNTNSDAQLFKLVDNGDGTYAICTKATNDESGIGVTSASKENGANVIQWVCNDSADQKWVLEIDVPKLNGNLVSNLEQKDIERLGKWKIDDSAAVGDLIFGDREFTYTQIPESLIGAELIQTACDSKKLDADLAVFTAAKDITVSVALDTRVESTTGAIPQWLGTWTKTGEQAASSNDVTFDIYEKSFNAGETVTLGTNGTEYSVINYGVFVREQTAPIVTTEIPEEPGLLGDANVDGVVDIADATFILQVIGNSDKYQFKGKGEDNADVYERGGGITSMDALSIQKYDAGLITEFPESVQ